MSVRLGVLSMVLVWLTYSSVTTAAERYGLVTFGDVPVPGATVTASRGDTKIVVSADREGVYTFADLAEGAWTLRVEMPGFVSVTREIVIGTDATLPAVQLALRPFAEVAAEAVRPSQPDTPGPPARPATAADTSASPPGSTSVR